jgi:hypothetical protein
MVTFPPQPAEPALTGPNVPEYSSGMNGKVVVDVVVELVVVAEAGGSVG